MAAAGAGVAGGVLATPADASAAGAAPAIEAVAFDALAVFDPRPVVALAEQLFPGRGGELSTEWRVRQFEYTWLRVVAGRYADFWQVTGDALAYAAKRLTITLLPSQRDALMNAWRALKAWPDAPPALAALKRSGLRLALLSNFTADMLAGCIATAGLHGVFDQVASTDEARTYKPDPRAYRLGLDALKLARRQALFVAYAGWDAAGAKSFGYPTFWVNRLKQPPEELGETPDTAGSTLSDLVTFLGRSLP
jgi:2-haloacid dehalogenase